MNNQKNPNETFVNQLGLEISETEKRDIKKIEIPAPKSKIFCGKGTPNFSKKHPKFVPKMLEFRDILAKFSPSSRQLLTQNNCTSPEVFARLTNGEIENFALGEADMKIMRCLVLQCRAKSQKVAQNHKPKLAEMADNPVTRALPIKSKVTLRALRKAGLLCPVNLYLFTNMEIILALFERYPSISASDRQNILMGMAIAKLANRAQKL